MLLPYKIADLLVNMNVRYPLLQKRAEAYRLDGVSHSQPCDFSIDLTDDQLRQIQNPYLGLNEYEYLAYGSCFYRQLLRYRGMMLHASAVAYQGKAYLFSAPCRTGKSTHAQQWRACFGREVCIINDDKPAIRFIDGVFYAYGTPFSGKTDRNRNLRVPLQAICILEQGDANVIEPVRASEAIYPLLHQTTHMLTAENMQRLLDVLDTLVRQIPVYRLKCTISEEAARVAYEAMSRDRRGSPDV